MKKKKVLVFGGGLMGRTIAEDLLSNDREVTIADCKDPFFIRGGSGVSSYQKLNAEDLVGKLHYGNIFGAWMKEFDLAVGAFPSKYGYRCAELAANHGVDYVDLSFTGEDLSHLHKIAGDNGSVVVPDCGVAPGLSNLLVGRLLADHGSFPEAQIYVGGVAQDKNINKYGYVRTWALDDLCQEYVRPARIVLNGKIETLPSPALQSEDMLEMIEVEGVGQMEAFISDGVRSLVGLKGCIPTIIEKTLRWPGHLKEVQKLLRNSRFLVEFEKLPTSNEDMLVMVVEGAGRRYELVDYGRPEKSAMARTTAHTCAAFAEYVLEMGCGPGYETPENIGQFTAPFDFILDQLKKYNVIVKLCVTENAGRKDDRGSQ